MTTAVAPETELEKELAEKLPLLEPGDRLARDVFERRYERMPHLKKAELIEGVVYIPSPARLTQHAAPHLKLATWLGTYEAETLQAIAGDNSTVRLDLDNEPQPDLVMFKEGGQALVSEDGYIEDAPEFVAEIVGSSRAYDLHQKKGAYRRNGVCEYLAWITGEKRVVWWELVGGEYREIPPDEEGIIKSKIFPALWLDPQALLRDDMKTVLAVLRRGMESRG